MVSCPAANESLVTRKFVNVCNEEVTNEDGLLSCSMMIKTKNTSMKERLWTNRVASEIEVQPLHPDTDVLLHDEPNLRLEFCQQGVTDGIRSPWNLRVDVISNSSQEVITVAKKN